MKKIIVLGGDGFCGWPTCLKLAATGYSVKIVDNLSRRKIDVDLGTDSLIPIASIEERINTANELVGRISFENIDITNYERILECFKDFKPDAIVHFAEQRAAPYSMIDDKTRRYTVDNNVVGTHNVLNAIVETNRAIKLVHLGTMGVYGYSKQFGKIPEGYLDITVNSTGEATDILYPANPGSVYHMTKCLDQLLFQYYKKNWDLDITDLHQGIVWGTQTRETKLHDSLNNRFDYDGIYGTVLNRFICQASSGGEITVYGTGGQTRAFIHVEDTANCIKLAVEDERKTETVKIFNQVAEVHTIKDLAESFCRKFGGEVVFIDNPRNELSKNDLEVENTGLVNLGFNPILLDETLIGEVSKISKTFENRINPQKNNNSPRW